MKIANRPIGQQQHKQLGGSYFGNQSSSIEGGDRRKKRSVTEGREEEHEAVRLVPSYR